MSGVKFKEIDGFPGYRVGDDGSVWSRRVAGRTKNRIRGPWRKLKPLAAGNYRNYRKVLLCRAGGTKPCAFYVHHLVLNVFVGTCPVGMEAVHENDIQHDNRLANLSWGTHKRNCELRRSNGKDKLGEARRNSKLTDRVVRWIRANRGKLSAGAMSRDLGVRVGTVTDVLNGVTWCHVK